MSSSSVILMLSGGRDSFLAACRLLESVEHYQVKMVTFDNGCSCQSSNAEDVAERIIKKYGADRCEYLGVINICGIWREFFLPYLNMKPVDQQKSFSGMTPSQFNCLTCRTSMYVAAILLAQREKAMYIAEGAREDQQFVIELPGMALERYPRLVESVGLKFILPVYKMKDDWLRDNELLRRGFISKSKEPKCLLGVPIRGSVDQSVIDGVHLYYDNVILPKIQELDLLNIEKASGILDKYDELSK